MHIDERFGLPLADALSADPAKRQLYAVDTYFQESWEDLREVSGSAAVEVARRTALMLLKPDAVVARHLHTAITWLSRHGFVVVAAEPVRLSRASIRAIWWYQWNVASRDRKDLCDELLLDADCLLLVLRGDGDAERTATGHLSQLKGPSDPGRRRPGQLRQVLGSATTLLNFVHTADEPADLIRELGILQDADRRRQTYSASIRGDRAEPTARTAADLLYVATAPADLAVDAALDRIARALAQVPSAAGLRHWLDEVRDGRSRDWRGFLSAASRAGVRVPRWDRLTIATALLRMDLPDGEVLIRGTTAAGPREHPES